MKIYINTSQEAVTIKDEPFIPGEWKHVPDTFVVDAKLYPYIKEAHIVLAEKTKEALIEKGLDSFAEGLKQAAVTYDQVEPVIVADIEKYAPIEVIEVVEVIK